MKNERMSHIQSTSRKFRLLFTTLLILIPVSNCLYWLLFNALPEGFKTELPVAVNQNMPLSTLGLAFLASLLPLGAVLFGTLTLKKLFSLYENAIIFSIDNVRCFRDLGYALMVWVLGDFIFTALISIVLTWGNPAGQREIVFQFNSTDISALIAGAILIVIARIMNEARVLEDEQAYIV